MKKSKTTNKSIDNIEVDPVNTLPMAPLGFKDAEKIITPTVQLSGHFFDQKLRPLLPRPYQESFFNLILNEDIKSEVQEQGIDMIGFNLTPSEEKLFTALVVSLRDRSENKNKDSENFYMGNYAQAEVQDWGGQETRIPTIEISPADLYKAYKGGSKYSGKDITEVNKTLASLANKKFLLRYERKRKVQASKGREETRTDIIEKYSSLISIVNVAKDLTDEEVVKYKEGDGKIRQNKGKLVIAFNPITTDQIKDKYVQLPCNITQITETAVGSAKQVTTALNKLRDYLLREISAKRYTPEINKEKLIYQLHLTKNKLEGRKAYVEKRIDDAIRACTNMGLIISHEIKLGAEGQDKYVFNLNKNFT